MSGERESGSMTGSTGSAGGRRVRYAAQSVVLFLAVTACCGFALVIADRFPARFDVTATREHQLSERTVRVLAGLNAPYEIVIAVNGASVDPRAAQRTQDVLGAMERASANLRITVLDAGSSAGAAQLDAALARIVERDKGAIERYRRVLADAGQAMAGLGADLSGVSETLVGALPTITATDTNAEALRRFLNDSAAFCRLSAKELTDARTEAESLGKGMIGHTGVPAVDEAAKTLRKPLANVITQLGSLSASLADLAKSIAQAVPEELRSRSAQVLQRLPAVRDRAARVQASLDDLPRLAAASIARTLEHSSAAIIIGPAGAARGGVTGVDVSSLFPPKPAADVTAPPPDTRARTEELLISAISALTSTDTPIVVLVHGEGAHIGPGYSPLAQWAERLRSRGVDIVEWAAALDSEPPSTAVLNPDGRRAVVYATISTNTGTRDGASRMLKLAGAERSLVEGGKRVLLSVNISELPTTGQADPMVEFLRPLGIEVDSARPLLQQVPQPTGRIVSADMLLTDPKTEHPIAGAIRNLVLRLPWSVPIRATSTPPTGVTLTPIVVVDNANGTIWAESEWASFRRIPIDQRSSIANPPAPDSSRDDTKGPWTIAASIERPIAGAGGLSRAETQRIVIVGSNGWFLDDVAQAQTTVYSQPVLFNPANAELFDASLAWLAGQDEAIAASPQARPQSLIPNLAPAAANAFRWGLIAGLPLLILFVGAVWRLVRG